MPRSQADALIHDETEAIKQVIGMAEEGKVIACNGSAIQIQADTLCIHGDNPHAVEFAKKIKVALS